MGGTGSGKTSTFYHLMRALMRHGAGMLFLTGKADDFVNIARMADAEGRIGDLIRFAPGQPWRFDFLNYELASPGGSLTTAGQLITDMVDFSTRTNTMNTNEPFWPIAAARKIRMAMTVVFKAKGHCGIGDVYRFCTTMPTNPGMIQPIKPEEAPWAEEWRQSFCAQCLLEAHQKCPNDADLALAADFVLQEWPRLSDRTGGCIDAYVMNLLEKFLHGSVRELIASGLTNLSPADLDKRKLIVIDMPVLVGREPYQFTQLVWKLMTQRHALRRTLTPDTLDLVLWCDEAHLHALPSVDSMVQAVARSHKLIQVAITQNIPLLEAVLKRREDVLAWISNLQSKFLFQNSDADTNAYFSALLGQSKQTMCGYGVDLGRSDPFADWMQTNQPQIRYSSNEQWLPDVRPEDFTRLRKGGKENAYMVECYVFQGGRRFQNGKTWNQTSFKQMV